jgi:hypothetical protein
MQLRGEMFGEREAMNGQRCRPESRGGMRFFLDYFFY